MTEYETDNRADTLSRIGNYLKTRSGEVWAFFVAGLLLGLIFG